MLVITTALLLALLGCGDEGFHPVSREQVLPTGKKVTVTSCMLVWGARPGDDGCVMGSDCFHLEFVSHDPKASEDKRTLEAQEVFELIRPSSESWGFTNAEMLAFQQVKRTGDYDLFLFDRAADGKWSCLRKSASVFAK